MDQLAELLRGIHAELKAAPEVAHEKAMEHVAQLGAAARFVGPQPFELGTLRARVEHIAANLDATVHVYLERKKRRRR
jgi:hypothetical protein